MVRYATDLFCWILEPLFVSRSLSHAIQNRIAKYKSNSVHLFSLLLRSSPLSLSLPLSLSYISYFFSRYSLISQQMIPRVSRLERSPARSLVFRTHYATWSWFSFTFSTLRKQLLYPVHAHTIIDYRNLADHIADHSTCPITRVIYYCPIRTYRNGRV